MDVPVDANARQQYVQRMSQDRIKAEWSEIAHRLRRHWHKLTRADVSTSGGSIEYLAGKLQERYGIDRREALLQVLEFESEL